MPFRGRQVCAFIHQDLIQLTHCDQTEVNFCQNLEALCPASEEYFLGRFVTRSYIVLLRV